MSVLESLEQLGEILSPAVRAALELLKAQVQELSQETARLRERVREPEACLGMGSRNSSKPPSSGPPQARRRAKGRRGKRGAREGHPGTGRDLLPEERVDEVLEYRAEQCRRCGLSLREVPVAGEPGRWQVTKLPPVRGRASRSAGSTRAPPPPEVARPPRRESPCRRPGVGVHATLPAERESEAEPGWGMTRLQEGSEPFQAGGVPVAVADENEIPNGRWHR